MINNTRTVIFLGALLVLTYYAIIHYDQEDGANTRIITGTISEYSVQNLRGGTIYVYFTCSDQDCYCVNLKYAIPLNEKSYLKTRNYYQSMFQELVDERKNVELTITNEKDLTYVYGHGRNHVVEIKSDHQVLFSIEGHNRNQLFRKWMILSAVIIAFVGYISYTFIIWYCTEPRGKK